MAARPVRLTVILAILACVALVAGGTAAVAESVPAPGDTITGVVTDQQGHPLPGIVIRLRDNGADEGSLVGTTTTDSSGRYQFTNIQDYTDDHVYGFYAHDPAGAYTSPADGATFNANPGGTTTFSWKMAGAGSIQGHVSTKVGDAPAIPAENTVVLTEDGYEAKVDAAGNFRLAGLPPGRYVVAFRVTPDGYSSWCYDNARYDNDGCHRGTTVTVTAGETTALRPQVLQLRGAYTPPAEGGQPSDLSALIQSVIDPILALFVFFTVPAE